MSKVRARGLQSYANEESVLELVPSILEFSGFTAIKIARIGQVKLVEAKAVSGHSVRFWLKLGWSGTRDFCAVQFGLFSGEQGHQIPDERFKIFVADRVAKVKAAGATHALFTHLDDSAILSNWVALTMDDVVAAYNEQLIKYPRRARNSKSATLWFEDAREVDDAACILSVLDREIDLHDIAHNTTAGTTTIRSKAASKKVTVEIERRMRQQAFRLALGNHYGWNCAVTGTSVKQALDAAHLPGRDWRFNNEVSDGILLRADLHKLLDAELAHISDGKFWIDPKAQVNDYLALNGKSIAHSECVERPKSQRVN